ASPNRIPGTGARDGDTMSFERLGSEKRLSVCGGHELGATFRARIWISTAHGLVLAISPDPFSVRVALVAGDVHQNARLSKLPARAKPIYGRNGVGGVGFDRILVAATHDGLCSHMNDHVGTALGEGGLEPWKVANVGTNRADGAGNPSLLEQVRLRWR